MHLSKVQRSISRRNGFLEFATGVELRKGEQFPISDRESMELTGFLSGEAAMVCTGVQGRVSPSISLQNGFADFARGVSVFGQVESPTKERTKNGLIDSESL